MGIIFWMAALYYQKRYFIFESGLLSIYNGQKEMMHEAIPVFLSETRCRFTHVHRCKKDTHGLDCRISDPIVHMNDTITGPFKNHSLHTWLEKKHNDRVENKPYDPNENTVDPETKPEKMK